MKNFAFVLWASILLILGCKNSCLGNRIDRQFPLGAIGKSPDACRCFCHKIFFVGFLP